MSNIWGLCIFLGGWGVAMAWRRLSPAVSSSCKLALLPSISAFRILLMDILILFTFKWFAIYFKFPAFILLVVCIPIPDILSCPLIWSDLTGASNIVEACLILHFTAVGFEEIGCQLLQAALKFRNAKFVCMFLNGFEPKVSFLCTSYYCKCIIMIFWWKQHPHFDHLFSILRWLAPPPAPVSCEEE